MSFNSFFSKLPAPLRQPNRLGMIASLGFHGVLFGVLPFLSLSKANESRRVVNLVQLSPAEQNRVSETAKSSGSFNSLPAFDVPTIELPPDLPPLGNLPPLNEIPSNFSSLPQVPPVSFGQPPISIAPFARPLPSVPQADIPAPSEVEPIPQPAPLAPPAEIPPMPAAPPPQLPDLEQESDLSELPPVLDGQPVNPDGEEPGSYSTNPDLGPIEQFPVDGIAQAPASGEETENTPGEDSTELDPDNPPEAATDDDITPEARNWYAKVQTLTRQADLSLQEVTTSLPYPKAACESKYEGTTVLGTLIGPDGTLVPEGELGLTANPEVLESSSYPILNQAAIEGVAGFSSYPATGKYQAYVYRIPFDYSEEECPKASPSPSPSASSPSPSASPTKTQTPTPSSTATPESTPSPSPSVSAEPSLAPTPTPAAEPEPLPSVSAEPTPAPAADPEPTPLSEPTFGPEPIQPFNLTPTPQPSPAAES